MQTTVTEAGRFERLLTLRVDEAELESAKGVAARKLSKSMKIKGFRPGKAPRAIVERMVGAETLRSEAIDEALPDLVGSALSETALSPVTTPRVVSIRDANGGVEVDVRVTLWPTADTVPDYEGRKIDVGSFEVDDDEIDRQIERLRDQFAELETVNRVADEGDFVMINLSAEANGKPLEEVAANDLLYEVGSRSFIAGLDDLLIGASAGDIREGPATLPEGFEGPDEVRLRVLVKEVRGKKLPVVTDDWVSDVTEFDTVVELREQLADGTRSMKRAVAARDFRDGLLTALIDELDVEIPRGLIDAETEASVHNLFHTLENQGLDLDNYLRITGQDQDGLIADLEARSERALRSRILLESVAAAAGIEATEDEIDAAITEMSQATGRDAGDLRATLAASGQVDLLAGDILRRKALEHIVEAATPVDGNGDPVDLETPERNEEGQRGEDDGDEHGSETEPDD
ncbi:MAG TPA: trigger factor [Acidimicrobiia bacterium]